MLKIEQVSKTFPGVRALDSVSIHMRRGEVHALLGENGAGKSTLIKILSGLHAPDPDSRIMLDGKRYAPRNTYDALTLGIHTVYQHKSIVEQASVAENIMLDKLSAESKRGIINWKDLNEKAAKHLAFTGLKVDPKMRMNELSIAQRQLVEITKAVASENKILLLDEPTASLAEGESKILFDIMKKLKEQGILIVFVSHILEEVLAVSDRITILRDGTCAITEERSFFDRKKIVQYMIGRDISDKKHDKAAVNRENRVLEVKNLWAGKKAFDINFSLYEGEILGFYGLVGSGRTELAKILIGHDRYDKGDVVIRGKKARIRSIREAQQAYRIGYMTEDRQKDGLILTETVKTNLTITIWKNISKFLGYIPGKVEKEAALEQVKNLNIKATGLNQKVGNLSGGNQQKVNLGKWLAAESEILIIDEPTVGVDVGAKEYFERLIIELSKKKRSIIVISSDMPEIVRLSHRILVFSGNRIVGEIDNLESDYKKTSRQISEYISEFNVAEPVLSAG